MGYIALISLSLLLKIAIAENPLRQLVCETNMLSLSCPRGYTINILTTLYGRKDLRYCNNPGHRNNNCARGNALDIIKFKCNLRQNCRVEAINRVFGDPCYDTRKYLDVTYECVKAEIKTSVACEGDKLNINCTDGSHLSIVNALFGRKDPLTCYKDNKQIKTNNCETDKAMSVMETRCNNLEECSVDATVSMFGNPCGDTYKYLEVDYLCLKGAGVPKPTTG